MTEAPDQDRTTKQVWERVSRSPERTLWNFQGIPLSVIANHTWIALQEDRLLGRAAELAFYFFFALFPSLFAATSLLGLLARSASHIYVSLLGYLSVVIPPAALSTVLDTFNQTQPAATGGKLTFGLAVAIWSASAGLSALQDGLNTVYKVNETRPFVNARLSAIGVTLLLSSLLTLMLASLLGGNFFAHIATMHISQPLFGAVAAWLVNFIGQILAITLLALSFAVIYYFAPNVQRRRWRWVTPGAAIGIVGWLTASLGFRLYVHLSNSYSVTYGSLGAVIILLTWFYLTALMILIGAEFNSEIEAAIASKHISDR